jgi:hypothetical protein
MSVTLVPNIYKIDNNVSLADMAGYVDKRNHVGVIGVSYMLKACFEKGKNFKFLIVFS